jgi:hypothetical protein
MDESRWTEQSLEDHVRDFLACKLTREQWAPHDSHIVTTVWHLRRYPVGTALVRMREAIQRFNASAGIAPELYHETVTRFYVNVIGELVASLERGQPTHVLAVEVLDALGTAPERRRELWARYYAEPEAVLASERARREWVPPDRFARPHW